MKKVKVAEACGYEVNPILRAATLAEQLLMSLCSFCGRGRGEEKKLMYTRGRVLYCAERMQKFRKQHKAERSAFSLRHWAERKRRRAEIKRRRERERVKRGRARRETGCGRKRGRTR